jgi:hypothetical protein
MSVLIGSSMAHAGPKWGQIGLPMRELPRGFERIEMLEKFESSRFEQSAQWSGKEKSALVDTTKMKESGIVTKQYVNRHDVAILEVGTNFYHLSGRDQHRVIKSFDVVYNYSAQGARMIVIKDQVTEAVIGTYGADGTFLH